MGRWNFQHQHKIANIYWCVLLSHSLFNSLHTFLRFSLHFFLFLKCNKILSLCRIHLMMQWNMQVMHVICTRVLYFLSLSFQITWHWSIVWYILFHDSLTHLVYVLYLYINSNKVEYMWKSSIDFLFIFFFWKIK